MKIKLSVALLGAMSLPAHAAEILSDVLVTATRTERTAESALAAVTVITRAEIERRQAQSLAEVLRGVPGLTLSNNGGAGKATSVFLRGTNADHVLVLVDGIKVGSATLGTASFENLPLAQVERIEIVRGPRASLYGSEAIGGVIQIFTRKGGGAIRSDAKVTLGSYGTTNAVAGLGGGGTQGWFDARINHQETQGFNACRGSLVAGCFVIEPDKDGYRNASLGLSGGYRFDNGVTADLNLLRADSFSKSDGSVWAGNETRAAQQVVAGVLKFAPLQAWNLTLRSGQSRDDSDLFFNGAYIDRYYTRRDSLSWQNDWALAEDHLLTAGLDYARDNISSSRAFAQTTRGNRALFGQYQGEFGAHNLQASLRRDQNQQFGGHDTGGLAYGYALNDGLRLSASYGTAFKAPTFNQLYYPGFGNAALRPESSRSIEIGIDGQVADGKWSMHAYRTGIADLIGFDAVTFAPANINSVRLTGVEGLAQMRVADWEVNGTLTLQDPRQTSGANNGKLLPRRATEAMRIELARGFGDYRLAGALYAEGRRFDDLANKRRLGGYGLLDLRAEYRVAADWRLQARLDNLLDKQYETAQFFNQPRRGVYLTLEYRNAN